jgi:hypothetical protein
MNARTLGRVLGAGLLAFLLAGCFKVNMDVEVSPENTVSGSAVIAFDQSLLELSGQSVDQLFQDMDLSDLPAGATVEPYEEDGFVGQEITFSDVPLDEFRGSEAAGATGEPIAIERRGDEFHVTGRFDMSGQEFAGGGQIPQGLLDRFEFRISITFPGEVKSSTGEVDGNTVTWEPRFGEDTRIEAVASAIPSESSPLMTILLIVAVVLILGAVAFLLLRRRPAPAAGPMDTTPGTPFDAATTTPMPTGTVTPPGEPTPAPPETSEPDRESAVRREDDEPPPVPPVTG